LLFASVAEESGVGIVDAGLAQREFCAELQTEPNRLDAGARAQQFPQHIGSKCVGALREFTCLLQRLPYPNIAQHFE
jgi:hypothetical protein